MTIEQLLENSAEANSKLTQKELEEFWKPYLDITRPDRPSAIFKGSTNTTPKAKKLSSAEQFMMNLDDSKKSKLNELMKDMDIDLEELL